MPPLNVDLLLLQKPLLVEMDLLFVLNFHSSYLVLSCAFEGEKKWGYVVYSLQRWKELRILTPVWIYDLRWTRGLHSFRIILKHLATNFLRGHEVQTQLSKFEVCSCFLAKETRNTTVVTIDRVLIHPHLYKALSAHNFI